MVRVSSLSLRCDKLLSQLLDLLNVLVPRGHRLADLALQLSYRFFLLHHASLKIIVVVGGTNNLVLKVLS
jgi:hypothetical protein